MTRCVNAGESTHRRAVNRKTAAADGKRLVFYRLPVRRSVSINILI